MPLAPPKVDRIRLSEDHLPAEPADTDTVNPSPAINAHDAALKPEGMRGWFMLSPIDGAKECVGRLARLIMSL